MGTNYYLRTPACPHCGHAPAKIHIGKSSAGWNFGLRVYPKIDGETDDRLKPFGADAIIELDDWRPLFDRFEIVDEYGKTTSAANMILTIIDRSHPLGLRSRCPTPLDDVAPGKGTYDLCNYEFS